MPPHPSQVLPLHGGVRGGLGELHYKGTDLIAHDVILRYLQELVRYDASHAPFRIVGTEVERTLDVEVAGVKLKVGGRIDRIDEMGGRLRIVDYKTGSHVPEKVKMENVVGLNTRHEDYYLQTFIYALASVQGDETGPSLLPAPLSGESLIAAAPSVKGTLPKGERGGGFRGNGEGASGASFSLPIQPVLFFPGKAAKPDYDPSLAIDGEVVDDFARQHAETFREGLTEVLRDIFNPDKPFTCATDPLACTYCKLSLLCGKG